jgi:hypothetical protein
MEFMTVNSLPLDTSFTAVYFVNNVIVRWASRRVQQRGDIARCKLRLHFDNSECHIV